MTDSGAVIAAETIADLSNRVYGLCGGHIQPIWDAIGDTDATIVDVRDERAAVHAAHADAEVRGDLGVAMVTAGPGFTNAVTGIANAYTSGVPLLVVTGYPPTPQFDRGALQGIPHLDIAESITMMDRTVYETNRIREYLVEAAATALDENGPVVVEIPTDVLRETTDWVRDRPVSKTPMNCPVADEGTIEDAAEVLDRAEQPLAILGRGARDAASEVQSLIETLNLPVLTTAGSKGVVPDSHELNVPGARGLAMDRADSYLVLGKRLDFTLGYGSPAVLGDSDVVQVDVSADALRVNRLPDVPVQATVSSAATELRRRFDGPLGVEPWVESLQESHEKRAKRMADQKRSEESPIHPYRVCGAIEAATEDDSIVICDGGDSLSFGRIAISTTNPRGYLDPGPLGCLGVGLPFAIGASLSEPDTDVVCFTGDGALGFNISEFETAVRENADITIVVANNAAWNIERYDQIENYGREIGSSLTDVAFDEVASGFGAEGISVSEPGELDGAIERAIETDGPVVVDVTVDPDVVSPDAKNGLARVPTFQPLDAWENKEKEFRGS